MDTVNTPVNIQSILKSSGTNGYISFTSGGTTERLPQGTTAATSSLSLPIIKHLWTIRRSSLVIQMGDDVVIVSQISCRDQTDINTHGASIVAYVDGSVTSNNVPARIVLQLFPSETKVLSHHRNWFIWNWN